MFYSVCLYFAFIQRSVYLSSFLTTYTMSYPFPFYIFSNSAIILENKNVQVVFYDRFMAVYKM